MQVFVIYMIIYAYIVSSCQNILTVTDKDGASKELQIKGMSVGELRQKLMGKQVDVLYTNLKISSDEKVSNVLSHGGDIIIDQCNVSTDYISVLEKELELIKADQQKIALAKAHARNRAFLASWGFVGIAYAQFGGIIYGTYWLYSWDIMEPITFLLGMFDACCAATYFAFNRQDFSKEGYVGSIIKRRADKALSRDGLSIEYINSIDSKENNLVRQIEYVKLNRGLKGAAQKQTTSENILLAQEESPLLHAEKK